MATNRYTVFGGEILAENRAGTKRDYVPDSLGSTRALLNSSQTQTDTWDYWPYGEEKSHTGASVTPFTFVGAYGYFSGGAGGTYVRARWYGASLGQWKSMDPLWPSVSSYAYADGSPTVRVDPLGLMPSPYGGSCQSQFDPYVDCSTLCQRKYRAKLKKCQRRCKGKILWWYSSCMSLCMGTAYGRLNECYICCVDTEGDFEECVPDYEKYLKKGEIAVTGY